MSKTWLVIDCNYLCHRALHSTHSLSHNGKPTGVAFGFFSTVLSIQETFRTPYVVFCWDQGPSVRKTFLPTYKARRYRNDDEEARKLAKQYRFEARAIRTQYLPAVGFANNLYQLGLEADDWMAATARVIEDRGDQAVLVTADQDLFQCISPYVRFYNPATNKTITLQSFTKAYGIGPWQWADVKSIAGCSSDNVPGVRGVGEKTAIKFLLGKLKPTSKKHQSIVNSMDVRKRNSRLVRLPWSETPKVKLKESLPSRKAWRNLMDELGMKMLRNQGPFLGRR